MLKDGANRSSPIMGKLARGKEGGGGAETGLKGGAGGQRGCLGTVCEGGVFSNARGEVGEGIRGSLYLWDPSTALTRSWLSQGACLK